MSIALDRLVEPQVFTWSVDVLSTFAIDDKQIRRTITVQDEDARAEDGSSWRWTRWISSILAALAGSIVIVGLFLLTLWGFRKPRKG
jgi:hypothetical protein